MTCIKNAQAHYIGLNWYFTWTDIGDSEPREYSESKKLQPYTSSYSEITALHRWWVDTISYCLDHSLNQKFSTKWRTDIREKGSKISNKKVRSLRHLKFTKMEQNLSKKPPFWCHYIVTTISALACHFSDGGNWCWHFSATVITYHEGRGVTTNPTVPGWTMRAQRIRALIFFTENFTEQFSCRCALPEVNLCPLSRR